MTGHACEQLQTQPMVQEAAQGEGEEVGGGQQAPELQVEARGPWAWLLPLLQDLGLPVLDPLFARCLPPPGSKGADKAAQACLKVACHMLGGAPGPARKGCWP